MKIKNIKNKPKTILPSLKEKKRYLVFQIISKNSVNDFNKVAEQINNSVLSFLGENQASKAGIFIMPERWDKSSQKGVIRVSNKYVKGLMASLALINKIGNTEVIVRSLGVSGILKKTERYFKSA